MDCHNNNLLGLEVCSSVFLSVHGLLLMEVPFGADLFWVIFSLKSQLSHNRDPMNQPGSAINGRLARYALARPLNRITVRQVIEASSLEPMFDHNPDDPKHVRGARAAVAECLSLHSSYPQKRSCPCL